MSPLHVRDLDPAIVPAAIRDRFWSRVRRDDGCWEWTGAVGPNGYCQVMVTLEGERRMVLVHRLAYALFHDIVLTSENAETLDHLCRNRRCVNPDHLEPVTAAENVRRSPSNNSHKTHCIRGHEFTPENTITRPSRNVRECRACAYAGNNERARRRRREQIGVAA